MFIATTTIGEIVISAATIKDEIEGTVNQYLLLKYMKNIIGANALESFTTIFDFKTPNIVYRLNETEKKVLKDYTWLKTHVESIAVKTTTIEKANIQ